MIAITNAQNIGFLKQVTTSKKKFNPTICKDRWKVNDYMCIAATYGLEP